MRRALGASAVTVVLLGSAVALTACDLLSEATKFTVCTDAETLVIDTAEFGVSLPSGSVVPMIPCTTGGQDGCAAASSQISCGAAASYECEIACGGESCQIEAAVEQQIPIDIADKVRNQTAANKLSDVTLSRVEYTVPENSLNFETPVIQAFVGPASASSSSEQGAVLFGEMPAVGAGQTISSGQIDTTQAGRDALAGFVRDFQNPFKLFAKANTIFASGSAIPQGKLKATIRACFSVQPL